ncbi:MAG TPA: hypothetical protein VGJ57_01365 [Nitrospirales bacterium]|jgi:hypothetical protein
MDSDDTTVPGGPDSDKAEVLSDEDAKRQAMRKRKPLGEVVKPLTKAQIDALLGDPEVKERDNLADALPKGWDQDYQDEF